MNGGGDEDLEVKGDDTEDKARIGDVHDLLLSRTEMELSRSDILADELWQTVEPAVLLTTGEKINVKKDIIIHICQNLPSNK